MHLLGFLQGAGALGEGLFGVQPVLAGVLGGDMGVFGGLSGLVFRFFLGYRRPDAMASRSTMSSMKVAVDDTAAMTTAQLNGYFPEALSSAAECSYCTRVSRVTLHTSVSTTNH